MCEFIISFDACALISNISIKTYIVNALACFKVHLLLTI